MKDGAWKNIVIKITYSDHCHMFIWLLVRQKMCVTRLSNVKHIKEWHYMKEWCYRLHI
jgi:hypothetical protein